MLVMLVMVVVMFVYRHVSLACHGGPWQCYGDAMACYGKCKINP